MKNLEKKVVLNVLLTTIKKLIDLMINNGIVFLVSLHLALTSYDYGAFRIVIN